MPFVRLHGDPGDNAAGGGRRSPGQPTFDDEITRPLPAPRPLPADGQAGVSFAHRRCPLPPRCRLGHLRVERLLAEGGMGRVYQAVDERTGRRVAVKQLAPEYARDAVAVARFLAEAAAMRRLAHPSIVSILDLVSDDARAPYYTMELLSGSDLAGIIAREGPLGWRRAARLASQLCGALAHVHAAGVVHRDLKPANIFIATGDGRFETVKLLDFGIAATLRAAARGAPAFLGTPPYTAPEQLAGAPADHRADLYALGVILYEMLTGSNPFAARTLAATALKHFGDAPPPPSRAGARDVPPNLDRLVMACLALRPDDRPADARAVGATLNGLATRPPRARRGWRRPWLALPVAAALAAAAATGAGGWVASSVTHLRRVVAHHAGVLAVTEGLGGGESSTGAALRESR